MRHLYRKTKNKREISKIFDTKLTGENFIWQNLHGRRFIHNIAQLDYDRGLNLVNLALQKSIKFIHPSSEFYLKLSSKETVCKLRYLNHSEKKVTFYIPETVETLEQRRSPRHVFTEKSSVYASVLVQSDLVTSATRSIDLKVMDVSASGIALVALDKDYEALSSSKYCILRSLNSVNMTKKFELNGVYNIHQKVLVGHKYKNGHKFGYMFSNKFDQFTLDQILLAIPG